MSQALCAEPAAVLDVESPQCDREPVSSFDADPHPVPQPMPMTSATRRRLPHRVLTVYQPHAQLIVGGFKEYETRSSPTPYRGLLFIHAGRLQDDLRTAIACVNRDRFRQMGFDVGAFDWVSSLPRGVIVGAVRLVDSITSEELVDRSELCSLERSFGDFSEDRHAWKLSDPVVFKQPVPCRGRQGLQCLPDRTLAAAITQIHISTNEIHAARLLNVVTEPEDRASRNNIELLDTGAYNAIRRLTRSALSAVSVS